MEGKAGQAFGSLGMGSHEIQAVGSFSALKRGLQHLMDAEFKGKRREERQSRFSLPLISNALG